MIAIEREAITRVTDNMKCARQVETAMISGKSNDDR